MSGHLGALLGPDPLTPLGVEVLPEPDQPRCDDHGHPGKDHGGRDQHFPGVPRVDLLRDEPADPRDHESHTDQAAQPHPAQRHGGGPDQPLPPVGVGLLPQDRGAHTQTTIGHSAACATPEAHVSTDSPAVSAV